MLDLGIALPLAALGILQLTPPAAAL